MEERSPISFEGENRSNEFRSNIATEEPISLRTYTPTQAVLSRSAGLYHYTPEGRRLADFTSGVLVANLGHNPTEWWRRFASYMGWQDSLPWQESASEYLSLPPLTSYNAISELEVLANERILASLHATNRGARLEQVMWSASGSEGIQKALWACLAFQPDRDVILATRHGFHGKKGLSEAVTGDEHAPNRDPRVRFIAFPKKECRDVSVRDNPMDLKPYRDELDSLWKETGGKINCLITEPYLGGGGSYHPPKEYLPMLVEFCREKKVPFILDEVQSNFGRTGSMYAFETYGIEPDLVVLGKGLGNGVPVNCVVGRKDILGSLGYGGASDTWSAHPLGCAAALATLDVFEASNVLEHASKVSRIVGAGLARFKELPIVAAVRGEGMVWGVELADAPAAKSTEVAIECVRQAYLGDDEGNAIHLLGPLAGNVLRVSPPLTMTTVEADFWMNALFRIFEIVARKVAKL